MHTHRWPAVAVLALALAACSADVTDPVPAAASGPALDIVVTQEEVTIPAAEFDEADADKDGSVCVKDSPNGELIIKDANANTPSQPCPPPFEFKGKQGTIKIQKEWLQEDANKNGIICVKETGAGRFIVKDDNLNTPSQLCPPAFLQTAGKPPVHVVPAKLLAQADDNNNTLVCLKIAEGSGNYLLKDDNLATPSQLCPPSYSLEGVGVKEPPAPPADPPPKG